jgi:type VI secretion system protein
MGRSTSIRRRDRVNRLGCWLIALSLAGACEGCGVPALLGFRGEKPAWSRVTLTASDDANGNSPVAVDFVMVRNEALLAKVAEMPASKWFEDRVDLENTFPDAIRYRSWELVPGQAIVLGERTFDVGRVAAVFVFARYPGPGAHRFRLANLKGQMVVQLNSNDLMISSMK